MRYTGDIGLDGAMDVSGLTGCFDLSNPISVTRVQGGGCDSLITKGFDTGLPVTIYPVPASTGLLIRLDDATTNDISLEVYNLLGKKVLQKDNLSGVKLSLDVSDLQLGNYILAIDNGLSLIHI